MLLTAAFAVTAVIEPAPTLTGNCNPTRVHFTGHIASEAPGQVTYTWVRLNSPAGRTFTLTFDKAGTLPVTLDLLIRKPEDGAVSLRVILPQPAESAKIKYRVACK